MTDLDRLLELHEKYKNLSLNLGLDEGNEYHSLKSQLESKLAESDNIQPINKHPKSDNRIIQAKFAGEAVIGINETMYNTSDDISIQHKKLQSQHTNLQRQHDALVKAIQDEIEMYQNIIDGKAECGNYALEQIRAKDRQKLLQNLLESTKEKAN